MDPESCGQNGTAVYSDVTDKVVGSLSITLGTLGLIGNLLVFLAISLSRKLQTITNVFVVSLAVSDFLTALILPLHGVGILSGNEYPLKDWVCMFVAFITLLSNPSSILTLTAIAINRCILITKPKSLYLKIYTLRNIIWMLIFIWVFSFLVVVLPQLIPATGGMLYDPCFRVCYYDLNHKMARASEAATAVLFVICSSIISFCYFRIFQFVRSHLARTRVSLRSISRDTSSSDFGTRNTPSVSSKSNASLSRRKSRAGPSIRQINITKNMACVVVVFFICTMPYSFYLFTKTRSIEGAFLSLLVVLPVCLNPIIYAAKHPVFKIVFKYMFSCKCKKIPWSKQNISK